MYSEDTIAPMLSQHAPFLKSLSGQRLLADGLLQLFSQQPQQDTSVELDTAVVTQVGDRDSTAYGPDHFAYSS